MRAGCLTSVYLCSCVLDLPPAWLLAEEPEILGMRMEVVAEGPHSIDLLPIPADRTRSEALPGDTVRIVPLAANLDGIVDLEPLQPRWFLSGASLRALREPIAACDPLRPLEHEAACEIGDGATIEFVVPPLRTDVPLVEQRLSVVMVAGIDRSTPDCVEVLRAESHVGASECLIAFRRLNLGPVLRLGQVAIEQGVPLPFDPDDVDIRDELLGETPDFSPEPTYVSLRGASSETRVWPGEPTTVPAGAAFDLGLGVDGRDDQDYVRFSADGTVTGDQEYVRHAMHFTAPALQDYQFAPLPGVDEFLMIVVTLDTRGSQSWAVFEFDVGSD